MITKVKSVQANGTYDSDYGTLYKFEYEMEDGTILTANHKAEGGNFKTGEEVEYEVKGESSYGKYGKVSKPQDQNFQQPTKAVDWDAKNKIIEFQTCLKVMGGIAINWNASAQSPETIAAEALRLYREMQNLKAEL